MRRKRSYMTEEDCIEAVREFAKRIDHMLESSEGIDGSGSYAPVDRITAKISVKGGFNSNARFFEAMRVLGEHKLPAKEPA